MHNSAIVKILQHGNNQSSTIWCTATTPDGNGELIKEKWEILLYHILDIHQNEDSQVYPECGHGELNEDEKDRLWLDAGKNNY